MKRVLHQEWLEKWLAGDSVDERVWSNLMREIFL